MQLNKAWLNAHSSMESSLDAAASPRSQIAECFTFGDGNGHWTSGILHPFYTKPHSHESHDTKQRGGR